MRDNESKVTRHVESRLLVTDMWEKPFSLSDIMLLSRVTQQGDKRSMVPNVGANVGEIPNFFHLYCEVYNREQRDSVRMLVSIVDQKGAKVMEFDSLLVLRPGRNEEILKISHGSLQLGDYRIFLRAYPATFRAPLDTGFIASTNKSVVVRWYGMPKSLKDLDLAIEQVRWIAKDDEMALLKEASTPEEKQKRFLEFWKKRDPNPNTPRNEKMEEYFQRVDYANRHFTHFRDGWRTDMGMIYLIFGSPSNVDRHPFDSDSKPYEIWSYYDLSFQVVFLDETGFGDYRLLTPLSEVYDRARMRR
jgi:GWxTD domain-containing protein